MRRFLAVSLIALVLAGCVGPPQAPEAPPAPVIRPTPRPTPPPPAPLAGDWNDWPFTPGNWSYARGSQNRAYIEPTESTANFGAGQPLLIMRCDFAARQVDLVMVSGTDANLVVRTTTMTRELPSQIKASERTMVWTKLSANDPLLDAIAFSRGRFVIEQKGRPPLVLPPYAEIGRVIEDCRG